MNRVAVEATQGLRSTTARFVVLSVASGTSLHATERWSQPCFHARLQGIASRLPFHGNEPPNLNDAVGQKPKGSCHFLAALVFSGAHPRARDWANHRGRGEQDQRQSAYAGFGRSLHTSILLPQS